MNMKTEPVATAGLISAITLVAAPLLARWGIDQEGTTEIVGLVLSVLSAAIAVYSWIRARANVTPLVRPQNDEGVALIPITKAA